MFPYKPIFTVTMKVTSDTLKVAGYKLQPTHGIHTQAKILQEGNRFRMEKDLLIGKPQS